MRAVVTRRGTSTSPLDRQINVMDLFGWDPIDGGRPRVEAQQHAEQRFAPACHARPVRGSGVRYRGTLLRRVGSGRNLSGAIAVACVGRMQAAPRVV